MIELDEKYVDVILRRYIEYVKADDNVYLIREGNRIAYKSLNYVT